MKGWKQRGASWFLAGWRGLMGVSMALAACTTGKEAEATPPAWLSLIQGAREEVCAVGVSGPTYYPEDARAYSKAQALAELARAREVKVTAELRMQEQGNSRSSETTVHEAAEFSTEVVIKLAQIRGQWISPGGESHYGQKGTVYTLACLPLTEFR